MYTIQIVNPHSEYEKTILKNTKMMKFQSVPILSNLFFNPISFNTYKYITVSI
jgi:hypothetical protein